MSFYRVEGMARVMYLEYCWCEYCQGHEEHEEKTISETVMAETGEEAIDITASRIKQTYRSEEEPRIKWLSGPTICEIDAIQDQLMRSAGYATLPGMT